MIVDSRAAGPVSCVLFAFVLAGCGYPGEPLPPALNRPTRVSDLEAVQRGSAIYIHFTVPAVTTENLPIRGKPDIELRIGPAPPDGPAFPRWEKDSERVPASDIRLEALPESPQPQGKTKKRKGNAPPLPTEHFTAAARVDASKLYGKTVLIGVRVHGPHGQDIGWSRLESLNLVPALPVPEGVVASNAPDSIRLDWHAAAPEFRIFRKAPEEPAFRQIGMSDKPFYVDTTIDYGKTYDYLVQSAEKTGERYAESEPSAGVRFKPIDTFAPAVPTGLTAVPGSRTIELVWERNTERDLASYQVIRDGMKIADGLTAPAYSDRDVKPGARYRYQISAADSAHNVSALCPPVEAAIP